MPSLEQEPRDDPGGVQAAIDRYRDLAKYLVGIFAAIGGLLIAGTQLSSLGELTWEDHGARLVVAVVALVAGMGAVILIVRRAVSILRPVEMALADVIDDPARRDEANRRPSLLGGADDVAALPVLAGSSLLDDAEREGWRAVVSDVVDDAAYREAERRFNAAWKSMLRYAIVGAAAIAVFAWAANPTEDATVDPVVKPDPRRVLFTLTDAGKETLAGPLGMKCVKRPVAALAIGGTIDAPLVVTLPRAGCKAVQFVLSSEFGVPVARASPK